MVSNWLTDYYSDNKSELEKYYSNLGIKYPLHIETIVLTSFKTVLNGERLNHKKIIKPFQLKEKKWEEEDKVRYTTDTLRGNYIPTDLEDCLNQMDGFFNDSTKNEFKSKSEDTFTGSHHFGLGTWMRNNWQLWYGSRLSKYFNNLGIDHPDDMSAIILTSYHRRLNGKKLKLNEQIKFYQDYWDKNK